MFVAIILKKKLNDEKEFFNSFFNIGNYFLSEIQQSFFKKLQCYRFFFFFFFFES